MYKGLCFLTVIAFLGLAAGGFEAMGIWSMGMLPAVTFLALLCSTARRLNGLTAVHEALATMVPPLHIGFIGGVALANALIEPWFIAGETYLFLGAMLYAGFTLGALRRDNDLHIAAHNAERAKSPMYLRALLGAQAHALEEANRLSTVDLAIAQQAGLFQEEAFVRAFCVPGTNGDA